jgi:HEAT repeat protein
LNPSDPLQEPEDLSTAQAWLADEDPRKRLLAAKALGRQGPNVASAVPALIVALADADPMVRSMVASALGRIGDAAAVAPLQARLADPVVPVRFWVLDALGRIGVAAPGLLETLRRMAEVEEAHVKAAAQRALARLGSKGA